MTLSPTKIPLTCTHLTLYIEGESAILLDSSRGAVDAISPLIVTGFLLLVEGADLSSLRTELSKLEGVSSSDIDTAYTFISLRIESGVPVKSYEIDRQAELLKPSETTKETLGY